jgi:hypothetical protein
MLRADEKIARRHTFSERPRAEADRRHIRPRREVEAAMADPLTPATSPAAVKTRTPSRSVSTATSPRVVAIRVPSAKQTTRTPPLPSEMSSTGPGSPVARFSTVVLVVPTTVSVSVPESKEAVPAAPIPVMSMAIPPAAGLVNPEMAAAGDCVPSMVNTSEPLPLKTITPGLEPGARSADPPAVSMSVPPARVAPEAMPPLATTSVPPLTTWSPRATPLTITPPLSCVSTALPPASTTRVLPDCVVSRLTVTPLETVRAQPCSTPPPLSTAPAARSS